jgi:hypothetical protein
MLTARSIERAVCVIQSWKRAIDARNKIQLDFCKYDFLQQSEKLSAFTTAGLEMSKSAQTLQDNAAAMLAESSRPILQDNAAAMLAEGSRPLIPMESEEMSQQECENKGKIIAVCQVEFDWKG